MTNVPVIISGGDPLAVALAASLGMAGIAVEWFSSPALPRQQGGIPGLLLPRHTQPAGAVTKRWSAWLTQFGLHIDDIAFSEFTLPEEPTPIAVLDITRFWQRFELIAQQQGVRTKRQLVVPYWEGPQVTGVQYGRQFHPARHVVLTTGMTFSRFWRLTTPATVLGDQALRHGHGHRARYTFPFGSTICVAGADPPDTHDLPLGISVIEPAAMQGIGLPSGPVQSSITIPAPGLISVWGGAGYGLYALPQLVTHLQQVLQGPYLAAQSAIDIDDQ